MICWWRLIKTFSLIAVATAAMATQPDEALDQQLATLDQQFTGTISSFVTTYCLECHGQDEPEAKLDLSVFGGAEAVATAYQVWELVRERLAANEMPPEDAARQPTPRQRQEVIDWIDAVRDLEAARHAGDPGPVLARRLSNAEFNYTIRDLTGVDIRPTDTFPVDPANEAGFDNSGESLTMSPALLNKYLEAARQIVEHLVLTPTGIAFAPHPVVTDTDRDKYCVNRIVHFYERQPIDYADYFLACWRLRIQSTADNTAALAEIAAANRVSAKYLQTIWSLLTGDQDDVGPIARLRTMWRALPTDVASVDIARTGCQAMRDYVVGLRARLKPQFDNLSGAGVHKGSQSFVLWKNRQYASHRMSCNLGALSIKDHSAPRDDVNTDLVIPDDPQQQAAHEAAFTRFCAIFPDAFYISERGRDYLDKPNPDGEKGRLLSAGFHSMMGYFRDDAPLYDLVLDQPQQRQLDALWEELDFVTSAPMRQYSGFVWFERTDSRFMRDPEFDFARAEDKAVTDDAMIERLAEVYLAKVRQRGGDEVVIEAIEDFFRQINAQIRWVEGARLAAEPLHIDALLDFASRAYRRNLTEPERDDLRAYYQSLRQDEGLSHEEAIQDAVVAVLMSPHVCYRVDLGGNGPAIRPLTAFELASRLSYFLWSSMPDPQLLKLAETGELRRPEIFLAQTKRMLRDDRVRGWATEFGGNWLDFRRFEEHNSVDRARFPEFTDQLRQSMFEEPIRFLVDVIQHDRSVLELLYADHTMVNSVLAKHYGIPELTGMSSVDWIRVEGAGQFDRGGLLPMSVFLTKNSPGLRTSPVKRGYWVVRRLLGERIPPPPPGVPELPSDETQLGELSLRETLARHRDQKSCAGCHDRFDSIGLVFEQYGPVGEQREFDLGGRPVVITAMFPGGDEGSGLPGLRHYLRNHRQADFLNNLCQKLLSYGLGRTLQISDDALVRDMRARLEAEEYRIGSLFESIVSSSQFLNKRAQTPDQ